MKDKHYIAWFSLFCVMISFGVSAQQQQPISPDRSGSIPVQSNEAIPVGPFIFSPAVELVWQDRDNIFYTPDDPVRDQVYIARARLLFEVPVFQNYIRFSYTPQYRDYKKYELEDKWAHFFDATGAFEFSNGLRLNATYKHMLGNLEVREVDPGEELVFGDRNFTKQFAGVNGSYWITERDGIIFDVDWTDLDHDDPDLFYDYSRLTGGVGWLHQLSQILVMDLRLGYSNFEADQTERFPDAYYDSKSQDLTLGLRGQISSVIATELRVGYRETNYEPQIGAPVVPDYRGPIITGFVSWQMAHSSSLRLDLIRSDYPSNSGPNAYYVATGGGLMYNYERSSFFAQVRGRFQNNKYEIPDPRYGVMRDDDIATFALGLGYRFTALLSLYGTYLYEDRDSTIYDASYETNIFSLGLVFGF